jgi:very-short-patch-repair endonuclease
MGEGYPEMIDEHNSINIANARQLRRKATDAERVLWKHLRMRQLGAFKFRRQQPIGPYIVDFICFEQRLIIELDGGQHTDQVQYDEKRSAWLKERGYRVLRYWNHDVLKAAEVVMADILAKIE